jgi:hypothetical protein
MECVGGKGNDKVHTKFWLENFKRRDHVGEEKKIILKCVMGR